MKSKRLDRGRLIPMALLGLVVAGCATPPATESVDAETDRGQISAERFEGEATASSTNAVDSAAEARRQREEAAQRLSELQAQREADRQAAAQAEAEAARERERQAQQAAEEVEAARLAAEQAEVARQEAEQARLAAAAERESAEQAASERQAGDLAAVEAERAAESQVVAERTEAEAMAEAEAAEADAQPAATVAEAADAPAPASVVDLAEVLPRTPENIARLGQDLTPMGSIRAGSEDGRIPEWTGGLTEADWPAGYSPGDRHPDPFAADQPLYVITGQNYREYADRLSAGQIATFQRYPNSYRMKVYPTQRSASFPQRIYDMSIQNASTGRLVANGEGVADVAEGFPFVLPQDAYEVMWNHKLKFKGTGGTRYSNQAVPTTRGSYQLIRLREELLGLYYIEGNTIEDTNNVLLYFFQEVESPARLAGNILLVHESLNQIEQPRQAWIYNPGQRRVRRAPNVAYDNPGTASDGLRTNDMTDMFNGAMDRFTWELVGKREMYIPYNSYQVHSDSVTPDDIIQPGHLNPDLLRYELHRVWVVDARLRPEFRHINPRRTFYFDEDSYQIALIDHYDARGELWRASEAHTINYYDVPTYWSTVEVHMDLQSGRYIVNGLDNQDPVNTFNVPLSPSAYTPQALRTRGRR